MFSCKKINNRYFLNESFYKSIKKTMVKNTSLWQYDEDEISIYKYPGKNSEVIDSIKNSSKTMRIGIDDDGDLYFWNGEVLHSGREESFL